jgi:hypothetical protein
MYQPLILGRGLPLPLDILALTIQITGILLLGILALRRAWSQGVP